MKKWFKKWLWRLLIGGIGFSLLITLPLIVINPPIWSWKLQRQISPPAGYEHHQSADWVDLDNISPHMQLAVIAAEDQLFPSHHGVDFTAIGYAIRDAMSGKGARGASTLTQQTVKNLYLWSGKNIVRKGLEAYLSLLVDATWSKKRILEVYLNIVEFGPGIYGVEAASQHYFGIPAQKLTASQAARLASVLPNPYLYSVKNPASPQQRRIAWIEKQMRQLGGARYLKQLD